MNSSGDFSKSAFFSTLLGKGTAPRGTILFGRARIPQHAIGETLREITRQMGRDSVRSNLA